MGYLAEVKGFDLGNGRSGGFSTRNGLLAGKWTEPSGLAWLAKALFRRLSFAPARFK